MSETILTDEEHRSLAVKINNATWDYISATDRTADDDEAMIRSAYAASYHWSFAARRTEENRARAEWLISRVHVLAGNSDAALHHAHRCLAVATSAQLVDFDLAYAHEAIARSLASLGRLQEAGDALGMAKSVPIVDAQDKEILDSDLAAEPWFGLM